MVTEKTLSVFLQIIVLGRKFPTFLALDSPQILLLDALGKG